MPPRSYSDWTETLAGDNVVKFDCLCLVADSPTARARGQAAAPSRKFTSRSPQLQQLLVVAFLSLTLVGSSETVQNRHGEDAIFKHENIEEYYFTYEISFLARQSMILGNYFGAVVDGKSIEDQERDDVSRLFLESSLQMELDYVRRLKSEMGEKYEDPKKSSGDVTNCTYPRKVTTAVKTGSQCNAGISETITNAIIEATWPNWVLAPSEFLHSSNVPILKNAQQLAGIDLSQSEFKEITINHQYDYDWLVENGFGWMHENLGCKEHAYNQNKPLYTPDMWRKLWGAFQESTLFPFQIPSLDESPEEPFYVGHTTDGKGRGNFASRNIAKGSLIHAGYPNTVFFLESSSWYRFVAKLPKMLACDVMEWAWQQDLTDSGNIVLCLNLDKAVFFNDGGWNESMNMETKERSAQELYATRDIGKDEELLYDYALSKFDTVEMDL